MNIGMRGLCLSACAILGAASVCGNEEAHPRLFLDPGRVEALRRAVRARSGLHREVFDRLRSSCETNGVPREDPYPAGWRGRYAALLYLLTVAFDPNDRGGYLICEGTPLYTNHNVTSVQRHLSSRPRATRL